MSTKATLTLCRFLFCLIPAIAVAQHYTVTDLGPLAPTGINTWGQVVGNYNGHAYIWTKTRGMQDLGILSGGTFSSAAAINDLGAVTGTADGSGTVISLLPPSYPPPDQSKNLECSDLTQPFVWSRKGMQGIGTVAGPSEEPWSFWAYWTSDGTYAFAWCQGPFYATSINNSGQVVGYTGLQPNLYQWAFLWTSDPGMYTFGGTFPPTFINGISNTGQMVGQTAVDTGCIGHATWWKNPPRTGFVPGTNLGTLGGSDYVSSANGVNDLGQVVGWSTTGPVTYSQPSPVHAVLWAPGKGTRDLGTLSGDASSAGSKINFFGQVIGSSGNTGYLYNGCFYGETYSPFELTGRPFIWSEGSGMRDLNTLIRGNSGWVLNTATDINVWGQIVGQGTLRGKPHGYLLTPRAFRKF